MIGIVLAFILLLPGAPAAQTASGTVTGQLQTIEGTPAIAVRVSALPVPTGLAIPADGPNYFNAAPPASTAITDNQGRYRLENIPPGRYYVMAGLIGEPTYYPASKAANAAGATVVTVAAGGKTDNLNFKLMFPLGRRVSGHVTQNAGAFKGLTANLSGSSVDEQLTVPLDAKGNFEFGRVPVGTYLLTVYPPPPGLPGIVVRVGSTDITGLEVAPPATRTVSGRVVAQNGGPIPKALLGFVNPQGYVNVPINPDGTFSVKLHPSRHRVDLGGMAVGYSLGAVRVGSTDASQGYDVGNQDVSGIVITVAGPNPPPQLRGRIVGLPAARLSTTKVELTGPIVGAIETQVQPDGSFVFPAVVMGLYRLRLPQVPEFSPMTLAVVTQGVTEVSVKVN